MNPKLLGVSVPVIVVELQNELLVETSLELKNPAIKVFKITTEVLINCICEAGYAFFQGTICEEIYYVGFIDWLVHYQPYQKKFEGYCKSPQIEKGMEAFCYPSLCSNQIMNNIVNNTNLEQKLSLRNTFIICRQETIDRSHLINNPTEYPEYKIIYPEPQNLEIKGKEATVEYPDINADTQDPLNVESEANLDASSDLNLKENTDINPEKPTDVHHNRDLD